MKNIFKHISTYTTLLMGIYLYWLDSNSLFIKWGSVAVIVISLINIILERWLTRHE